MNYLIHNLILIKIDDIFKILLELFLSDISIQSEVRLWRFREIEAHKFFN